MQLVRFRGDPRKTLRGECGSEAGKGRGSKGCVVRVPLWATAAQSCRELWKAMHSASLEVSLQRGGPGVFIHQLHLSWVEGHFQGHHQQLLYFAKVTQLVSNRLIAEPRQCLSPRLSVGDPFWTSR